VVIFGGRRFANPEPDVFYESEFVNDVALLRVDSLVWYKVRFKHEYGGLAQFPELFNFSSSLIDDRVIIFGGM